MKNVLVTGGTVFVIRYVAEYYVKKGYNVYVLNRNHHPQSQKVKLIEKDRNHIGDSLKAFHFDIVFDICAYRARDIHLLCDALGSFDQYIFVSSSAVYPQDEPQPFTEETKLGPNYYWKDYGINKIEAEKALLERVPDAYILRPPYLYGPMNNVYREAFVFDCALKNRKFYLPLDGQMQLQFFHVEDLCHFMDKLIEKRPLQHIYNVGNLETISIKDWVELCYEVVGKQPEFVHVYDKIEQRNYFCFYHYEYKLDVKKQSELLSSTISLKEGLKDSYQWYIHHQQDVNKKPFFQYIEDVLANKY